MTDGIDFGSCAKIKMAAIELLNIYTLLKVIPVNAISLKPFHQSTSNLKIDLFWAIYFGPSAKTRWQP